MSRSTARRGQAKQKKGEWIIGHGRLRDPSEQVKRFCTALAMEDAEAARSSCPVPTGIAKKIAPSDPSTVVDVIDLIGARLIALGLYEHGQKYLAFAAERDPEPTSLRASRRLNNRATAAAKAGDLAGALDLITKAVSMLKASPLTPDALALLAMTLLHKGQFYARIGEVRPSQRAFEEGLALRGGDSSLLGVQGRISHEIGYAQYVAKEYSDAVSSLRKAQELKRSDPSFEPMSALATRLTLGQAMVRAGDISGGCYELERVVGHPGGRPFDFLRLLAMGDLASLAAERGDWDRFNAWVDVGGKVVPSDYMEEEGAIYLELVRIRYLPSGLPQREALQKIVNRLTRIVNMSTVAANHLVDAQYGIVASYLFDDDLKAAERHAKDVLPTFVRLAHAGLIGGEHAGDMRQYAEAIRNPNSMLSDHLRAVRVRGAFNETLWKDGEWVNDRTKRDMETAKRATQRMLKRIEAQIPGLPEIEVAFLHNDLDARASIRLFRGREIVGIRTGAITRIGETLDVVLRSPKILAEWKLEQLSEGRIAVISGNGYRLATNESPVLDPVREFIRSMLLELSMGYLLCHELAHLIFGHQSFRRIHPDTPNRVQHAFEMDADTFAIRQTIEVAFASLASNVGALDPRTIFRDPAMVLQTAMLAIYAYYRCLGPIQDMRGAPFQGTHPPSSFRYIMLAEIVNANVPSLARDDARAGTWSFATVVSAVEEAFPSGSAMLHVVTPSLLAAFTSYLGEVLESWAEIYEELCGLALAPPIKPRRAG